MIEKDDSSIITPFWEHVTLPFANAFMPVATFDVPTLEARLEAYIRLESVPEGKNKSTTRPPFSDRHFLDRYVLKRYSCSRT